MYGAGSTGYNIGQYFQYSSQTKVCHIVSGLLLSTNDMDDTFASNNDGYE